MPKQVIAPVCFTSRAGSKGEFTPALMPNSLRSLAMMNAKLFLARLLEGHQSQKEGPAIDVRVQLTWALHAHVTRYKAISVGRKYKKNSFHLHQEEQILSKSFLRKGSRYIEVEKKTLRWLTLLPEYVATKDFSLDKLSQLLGETLKWLEDQARHRQSKEGVQIDLDDNFGAWLDGKEELAGLKKQKGEIQRSFRTLSHLSGSCDLGTKLGEGSEDLDTAIEKLESLQRRRYDERITKLGEDLQTFGVGGEGPSSQVLKKLLGIYDTLSKLQRAEYVDPIIFLGKLKKLVVCNFSQQESLPEPVLVSFLRLLEDKGYISDTCSDYLRYLRVSNIVDYLSRIIPAQLCLFIDEMDESSRQALNEILNTALKRDNLVDLLQSCINISVLPWNTGIDVKDDDLGTKLEEGSEDLDGAVFKMESLQRRRHDERITKFCDEVDVRDEFRKINLAKFYSTLGPSEQLSILKYFSQIERGPAYSVEEAAHANDEETGLFTEVARDDTVLFYRDNLRQIPNVAMQRALLKPGDGKCAIMTDNTSLAEISAFNDPRERNKSPTNIVDPDGSQIGFNLNESQWLLAINGNGDDFSVFETTLHIADQIDRRYIEFRVKLQEILSEMTQYCVQTIKHGSSGGSEGELQRKEDLDKIFSNEEAAFQELVNGYGKGSGGAGGSTESGVHLDVSETIALLQNEVEGIKSTRDAMAGILASFNSSRGSPDASLAAIRKLSVGDMPGFKDKVRTHESGIGSEVAEAQCFSQVRSKAVSSLIHSPGSAFKKGAGSALKGSAKRENNLPLISPIEEEARIDLDEREQTESLHSAFSNWVAWVTAVKVRRDSDESQFQLIPSHSVLSPLSNLLPMREGRRSALTLKFGYSSHSFLCTLPQRSRSATQLSQLGNTTVFCPASSDIRREEMRTRTPPICVF